MLNNCPIISEREHENNTDSLAIKGGSGHPVEKSEADNHRAAFVKCLPTNWKTILLNADYEASAFDN